MNKPALCSKAGLLQAYRFRLPVSFFNNIVTPKLTAAPTAASAAVLARSVPFTIAIRFRRLPPAKPAAVTPLLWLFMSYLLLFGGIFYRRAAHRCYNSGGHSQIAGYLFCHYR